MGNSSRKSIWLAWLVLAPAITALANPGWAQEFPAKPVRWIVPYAAGGTSDFLARFISQKLAEAWGQNVLVDNRAGAAGNLGTDAAAKSPPDGYTILLVASTFAMNPSVYPKLPFDPEKDFTAVTRLIWQPFMLVVHPSLPGFEEGNWQGVLAPAGIPRPILARLNQDIVRVLRMPEINARFVREGVDVIGDSPEEFAAVIRSDMKKYGQLVRATGIRAD